MNPVRAIQVTTEFDKGLFLWIVAEGGAKAWNSFVADLFQRELLGACWGKGDRPPPVAVMLDLSGISLCHKRLAGLDLSQCWLENADFEGSSLKNSRLGCCPKANLRRTWLQGASFNEVTGCDFTDAHLHGVDFDNAVYDPADPPKGLTPDLMAACKPAPNEPPRNRHDPIESSGFSFAPLKCRASVHFMPME